MPGNSAVFGSTPSRIRTYDLRIRSPLLYPAELWAREVFTPRFVAFPAIPLHDSDKHFGL